MHPRCVTIRARELTVRRPTVFEYTSPRICTACHQPKELSEYYPRPGGKYLCAECKDCMKARSKRQTKVDKKVSTIATENDVITELAKLGIPALPGKALSHQWADVVAFGCVLIEVKSATLHHFRSFDFGFTASQQAGKLRGDIIVLVCKYDTVNTFHVFPSSASFFRNEDGKLKTAVAWTPNRKFQGRPAVLTDDMMSAAKDNWDIVERYLTKVSAKLAAGHQLPIKLNAA